MDEKCEQVLTQFGVSPTSARVYLALLEYGKTSADTIAKRIGTYKANVYESLDRLMDLGLATYIFEGKKKAYLPTRPEKLASAVQEAKEKSLEHYEKLRRDINLLMPRLSAAYLSLKERDVFEVYRGGKAYKAMIQDILRDDPKYWKGFGNLQVQAYFPRDFPKWFKRVRFRLFATPASMVLHRLKEARKTTRVDIRWLPKELYMPIVWTLFGENLLILIYEPQILALRIKSEPIVKTFSNQFDYLWKKAS